MKKEKLYGKEVFQLTFYSTNVFLEVCDVLSSSNNINKVRVREIETYEHQGYDMLKLSDDKKHFKERLIPLLGKDEYTYFLEDGLFKMPIEVNMGDKLYLDETAKNPDTIAPGIYFAEMVGDGTNDSFSDLVHTGFTKLVTSSIDIHWS